MEMVQIWRLSVKEHIGGDGLSLSEAAALYWCESLYNQNTVLRYKTGQATPWIGITCHVACSNGLSMTMKCYYQKAHKVSQLVCLTFHDTIGMNLIQAYIT